MNNTLSEMNLMEISRIYVHAAGKSVIEKYGGPYEPTEEKERIADRIIDKAKAYKTHRSATWRNVLKRVAIIALVLGITAGAIFTFSEPARAAIVNWFREIKGDHIIYKFVGEDNGETIKTPIFGWLPEGFEQVDVYQDDSTYDVYFEDGMGESFLFRTDRIGTLDISEIITPEDNLEKITVNGFECDYYQTLDETEASFLIWQDDNNNVVCALGSTLDRDLIIKIAENISF